MKIAYNSGYVLIAEPGAHYAMLKAMGMKWDRNSKMLKGIATVELLDFMDRVVVLPESLRAKKLSLRQTKEKINKERANEEPHCLIQPPLKKGIKPYKHQIRGYNMALIQFGLLSEEESKDGKGFAFLFEMGCGKTLTAIMTIGALYQSNKAKKVLIVAPSSVCSVWPKEFEDYAGFDVSCRVLMGTSSRRAKTLRELATSRGRGLKVAVINYESIWRDEVLREIIDFDADVIICDESQRIKNPKAKQSETLHTLGDEARYKLILSGTPLQNNAIDIYSQYRFLDPTVFGDNFYAFRNHYAIMSGFKDKQVIGYRDLTNLMKKIHSIAYRVTKAEALDLPEQIHINRYIELSAKERVLYRKIKKDGFIQLQEEQTLKAPYVITRLLRLQQLAGGFLVTDENSKPTLVGNGKLNALEDIIDDYCIQEGKKIVIFARFKAELELIESLVKKKGLDYGLIYGDVKQNDRGEIVKDFQENPKTMIFIAQIDTAGLGITLTAADTCVYYSVNFNYAAYSQSLARIHRIGQRNACTYIHLIAKGTIDEDIMKALGKKENLIKTVIDNWKIFFKEE